MYTEWKDKARSKALEMWFNIKERLIAWEQGES